MILRKIMAVAFLAIAIVSCKETVKNNSANDVSVEITTETEAATKNRNEIYEKKVVKINAITDNYNGISSRAFKVYEAYIDLFGDDPNKYRAKSAGDVFEIHDHSINSLKELDNAITLPVLEELNPYMEAFKNSGLAFSKTMNELNIYYEMQDFNTDDFEKGKTLHKPVIERFQQFYEADSILRVHSGKALAEIDEEYMNILKEGGHVAQYLAKKAVINATSLMEMISNTEYENLEAEKLKELHDPLRATFDELTALKTNDYKKYIVDPSISLFYTHFEIVVKASNALYLRVQEQRPFSKMDKRLLSASKLMASQVTGSPNSVSYKYKEMITSYNRMR